MAQGAPKGHPRWGGRAKGTLNKRTLEQGVTVSELAQKYAPEAIETLVQIMRVSESDPAKIAAANSLLDRGYGKPGQSLEIGNKDGKPFVTINPNMSDQDAISAYQQMRNLDYKEILMIAAPVVNEEEMVN